MNEVINKFSKILLQLLFFSTIISILLIIPLNNQSFHSFHNSTLIHLYFHSTILITNKYGSMNKNSIMH